MASLEERIAKLEDLRALEKLVNNYHQRPDEFDWVGWADNFTEDALFIFEGGFGEMRGRQGIMDICKSSMDPFFELMQHIIVNLDCTLTGPDTASATANLIFSAVADQTRRDVYYQSGGRYKWEMARTPQGWRISKAHLEFLWNNGGDADNVFEGK